jgi:hypothetical protein
VAPVAVLLWVSWAIPLFVTELVLRANSHAALERSSNRNGVRQAALLHSRHRNRFSPPARTCPASQVASGAEP